MSAAKIRKHSYGVYRLTLREGCHPQARFAQFIRGRYYDTAKRGVSFKDDPKGRWWRAEIRDTNTGGLIRHAGIWRTLADCVNEVSS